MSRQELDYLREQLRINEVKQGDLRVEAGDLEDQIGKISRQLILDEKILAGTEWSIQLSSGKTNLYLEYEDGFDSAPMKKLKDLFWNGWHSSYSLTEEYELHFDDTRITIWFDSDDLINEFVELHQIKLINSCLPDMIERSKIELEALQKLASLVRK